MVSNQTKQKHSPQFLRFVKLDPFFCSYLFFYCFFPLFFNKKKVHLPHFPSTIVHYTVTFGSVRFIIIISVPSGSCCRRLSPAPSSSLVIRTEKPFVCFHTLYFSAAVKMLAREYYKNRADCCKKKKKKRQPKWVYSVQYTGITLPPSSSFPVEWARPPGRQEPPPSQTRCWWWWWWLLLLFLIFPFLPFNQYKSFWLSTFYVHLSCKRRKVQVALCTFQSPLTQRFTAATTTIMSKTAVLQGKIYL